MKRILVTGATGNIGMEVIHFLSQNNADNKIIAAVRNIEKGKKTLAAYPQLDYVGFDFEDPGTFNEALQNVDCLFLLRPPHIANVDKFFKPLIQKVKEEGVKEIVFLSVQGAERSSVIPHNKIEKLIKENNLDYIFLRPSYFMQNLTTTLLDDIKEKQKIILPSGKAKFNWIDGKNIGEVAAQVIHDFENFKNQAFEVTGHENRDFYEVSDLIRKITGKEVRYQSVNPIRFFRIKKKDGLKQGMIFVMIMLHFLPRFQKAPRISDFYEKITAKKPATLKQFIEREKEKFSN